MFARFNSKLISVVQAVQAVPDQIDDDRTRIVTTHGVHVVPFDVDEVGAQLGWVSNGTGGWSRFVSMDNNRPVYVNARHVCALYPDTDKNPATVMVTPADNYPLRVLGSVSDVRFALCGEATVASFWGDLTSQIAEMGKEDLGETVGG